MTGLGSEASGRIRLHRPLPAPPRKALTRLGLVLPASHRPPAVGLPVANQSQSFQGLCSQSKGPRCQSTKNSDKGRESPCEPRELGCTVETGRRAKKKAQAVKCSPHKYQVLKPVKMSGLEAYELKIPVLGRGRQANP